MKQVSLVVILSMAFLYNKAQQVLTPSKHAFEKKWVNNKSYQMAWYFLRDTTKMEIGKVTTQVLSLNNRLTVVTHVNMKNMKAPWVDSTIADAKTLQPIYHASYNMQRDMVLNFGKVVTGFYNDKMKKKNFTINDTTTSKYFDSNIYPVLIGWLPLQDGYKKEIAIYDYNPNAKTGILKASVENVTSGTYQSTKSGTRNVWIVTVSDEIGNGENGRSTYYFDKVDRKLWQQEINANGRKMLMQLIEQ